MPEKEPQQLTKEEKQILIEFCLTRPLNGLNLLQAQKITEILQKLKEG